LVGIRAGQGVAAVNDRDAGSRIGGRKRGCRIVPGDERDAGRQTGRGSGVESGQNSVGGAIGNFVAIGEQQHTLGQRCAFGQHEMRAKVG
jgi:hypothetical protein